MAYEKELTPVIDLDKEMIDLEQRLESDNYIPTSRDMMLINIRKKLSDTTPEDLESSDSPLTNTEFSFYYGVSRPGAEKIAKKAAAHYGQEVMRRAKNPEYKETLPNYVKNRIKIGGKLDPAKIKLPSEEMMEDFNKLVESTGQPCEFMKASDGKWYLGLGEETGDGEYEGETIWYGPFPSEEATDRYLSKNFANPGGMMVDDSGKRQPPKTRKMEEGWSQGIGYPAEEGVMKKIGIKKAQDAAKEEKPEYDIKDDEPKIDMRNPMHDLPQFLYRGGEEVEEVNEQSDEDYSKAGRLADYYNEVEEVGPITDEFVTEWAEKYKIDVGDIEVVKQLANEIVGFKNDMNESINKVMEAVDWNNLNPAQQKLIDELVADYKPIVDEIESGIKTTKNNYGKYMAILGKTDASIRNVVAYVLVKAGADPEGVRWGMKLASGSIDEGLGEVGEIESEGKKDKPGKVWSYCPKCKAHLDPHEVIAGKGGCLHCKNPILVDPKFAPKNEDYMQDLKGEQDKLKKFGSEKICPKCNKGALPDGTCSRCGETCIDPDAGEDWAASRGAEDRQEMMEDFNKLSGIKEGGMKSLALKRMYANAARERIGSGEPIMRPWFKKAMAKGPLVKKAKEEVKEGEYIQKEPIPAGPKSPKPGSSLVGESGTGDAPNVKCYDCGEEIGMEDAVCCGATGEGMKKKIYKCPECAKGSDYEVDLQEAKSRLTNKEMLELMETTPEDMEFFKKVSERTGLSVPKLKRLAMKKGKSIKQQSALSKAIDKLHKPLKEVEAPTLQTTPTAEPIDNLKANDKVAVKDIAPNDPAKTYNNKAGQVVSADQSGTTIKLDGNQGEVKFNDKSKLKKI